MNKKELAFVDVVYTYYKQHGRHELPWRQSRDSYAVMVSEVMLQQTQVERVIPKYQEFVTRWPDAYALSRASLKDVLVAWQGLGYNRRAKMLHACAQRIVTEHAGIFPASYKVLLTLPGIGPYTAGAIMAFAFNIPHVVIETNIRTVYLYHFFKNKEGVSDSEILPLIHKTLDVTAPALWYAALMDYGTYLKKTYGNNTHKSKHYIKQSAFAGSSRQLRGVIIRVLSKTSLTEVRLRAYLTQFDTESIKVQLHNLCEEGLIEKKRNTFRLPT